MMNLYGLNEGCVEVLLEPLSISVTMGWGKGRSHEKSEFEI